MTTQNTTPRAGMPSAARQRTILASDRVTAPGPDSIGMALCVLVFGIPFPHCARR